MHASVLSEGRRPQRASRRPCPAWLRLALLAVLLLAFGLRLQELTRQNIWWDEARNIDVALRPFWQIPTAPELDIQPPLYYWLLHAWNGLFGVAIGQAPDALALASRLMSVFAGVCGVALLAPLARRVLPVGIGSSLAGLLAALVGAASPFWLAESQEARMYTLGFALLAAAALALLRHLDNQEWIDGRRRGGRASLPALGAFVLLAAASLLTHYNAVFVLVTWFAWWGVWALVRRDRWRQLAMAVATGLAMTLLVLPMLPIAMRQIPDYENPNITIPSAIDYLWQNWQAYTGGYAFDPGMLGGSGTLWLWAVLGVGAIGLGVAIWTIEREEHLQAPGELEGGTRLTFLLAWLAGSLALYYVAVLDRNAFNVRYASFVTPALYALLGVGMAAYTRWWRPLPVAAAALLLVGLVPALQADLYDARFDREHTAEAAAWLRANTGPGDVIFVDQKYPFGFYYQPYVIPDTDEVNSAPAGASEGTEDPARYLFVDINTIDQRLSEWAGNARRVFWLQWYESDTDPRKAVRFLLDKYGRHSGEQSFQGYSLEWWEMDPPTHFALAPNLQPARYAFPPVVETAAVSLPAEALHAGDPLPVAIRWQRTAGEAPAKSFKARVALYDAGGARVVQSDERLLNDRHRAPWQWQAGDQPLNVYMLPLPPDLAPGTYNVGLLVYDADTLEAVTLVDEAGNPAGQEATIGTVEVETR